jgi:hypothetical protein
LTNPNAYISLLYSGSRTNPGGSGCGFNGSASRLCPANLIPGGSGWG